MSLLSRLVYRIHQFRLAAFGPWQPVSDASLSPFLSPQMISLFRRMKPSEQAHSFSVLQRLQAAEHLDQDLLAAALLHDVGKVNSSPSIWDRSLVVLGKRLIPRRVVRWSSGKPAGWSRPFVVAAHHPAWGADLMAAAGASPRSVDLVRRHHEAAAGDDPWLAALRQADDSE